MFFIMADKTLTPRQFAELHEVGYTTVMRWIKRKLIPFKRDELPYTGYVYLIPAETKPPELTPGPKPSKKAGKAKKSTGAKGKAEKVAKVTPPRTAKVKVLGKGIQRAHEAISCLKHIFIDDPLRDRAFQIVADWIEQGGSVNQAEENGAPAKAIACAYEAIDCLKRIPKKDALKDRGFQIVADWIEYNRQGKAGRR